MNLHRALVKRAFLLPASIAIVLSGAGCRAPAAPSVPGDDPAFTDPTPPERPGIDEADEDEPDVIRPGDVLAMRTLGGKDVDAQLLPVDRGGFVHVPLAGEIRVADQTLTGAERSLQAAIARYDRRGRVVLSMSDTKGRFATITGAVEHPGNVPLVGDARLAEILAVAGGPKATVSEDRLVPLGDLDGTRLVRRGRALPVSARKAAEGDPRHNVRVRPGDLVVVPPAIAARIVVLGQVARPRTMSFRAGLRLSEALADAGGLTQAADAADVRILRGGYARPRLFVASARDVLSGKRSDPVLAPGDVIYVSEHWLATVAEVVERVIPATTTALLIGSTVRAK